MTDRKIRLLEGAYGLDLASIIAHWSARPESYEKIARLWNQAVQDVYPGQKTRFNGMDAHRILDRPARDRKAA